MTYKDLAKQKAFVLNYYRKLRKKFKGNRTKRHKTGKKVFMNDDPLDVPNWWFDPIKMEDKSKTRSLLDWERKNRIEVRRRIVDNLIKEKEKLD